MERADEYGPAEEDHSVKIYTNKNILHAAALAAYTFIIIHIQFYILCLGQMSPARILSQILVLVVLIVICPFLLTGVRRFSIPVKDRAKSADKTRHVGTKTGIVWGISCFILAFIILYYWYQAYYPGVFSTESVVQYKQALAGKYSGDSPLLQTWITFVLPIRLTGKASSVVLFQIAEYAVVIAYMSYVLFQYGGKIVSAVAFLYVIINPATGCMAVCPWDDTTFAMCAVLLMTLGLQIHMTDGKWLASKRAVVFFTVVLLVTTLVKHTGFLFTLPYLIAVLIRIDNKKKIRLIIYFILGVDLIGGSIFPMLQDGEASYKIGTFSIPMTMEELQGTDLVYAIDGTADWGIWPGLAENDLGLELQENGRRDLLAQYTEYSRNSGLKYLFWYIGIINLTVVIAALGKGGVKSLYALPLLCYNFGSMFLRAGSEFRYFYLSFPILPVLIFLLFGEKRNVQGDIEKTEGITVGLSGISWSYAVAILYTFILFALNFIMVFNINFWSDEGYSIMLSRMSFTEMINATAGDVHPPLYYILLQIICRIMGFQWISYRLLSIIPYGIILCFALTVIWKRFGKEEALILITCSSLLNTAIDYNVQTRMYSWGALFVLMSFYCMRGILEQNRMRDYAGFVVMSLGAAYTHYYCLISVAFFYLVLLLVAAVRKKEYLAKVLGACVITVIAYMPWFFILLQTFMRTSEGYWMTEIPSLKECMLYLFSSRCEEILLAVFLAATVGLITYETGILQLRKLREGQFPVLIKVSAFHMSRDIVWMTAGLVSIIGTALTGIAVSRVFRPMFSVRYVYPISAVAWLILGISLSKCRKKAVCAAVIVVLIVRNCLPFYLENYQWQKYCEDKLRAVLDVTEEISGDDVILTDALLMNWTIINTYYPGIPHREFMTGDMGVLQEYDEYWLFLENEIDSNEAQLLKESGYEIAERVSDGNLGRMTVYIYEVKKALGE